MLTQKDESSGSTGAFTHVRSCFPDKPYIFYPNASHHTLFSSLNAVKQKVICGRLCCYKSYSAFSHIHRVNPVNVKIRLNLAAIFVCYMLPSCWSQNIEVAADYSCFFFL